MSKNVRIVRDTCRACVLACLVVSILASGALAETTTVVVVRHAEKRIEPGNLDPELTEAGLERAQALAMLLRDVPIEAVYSSDFRRTRTTAGPTARAARVETLLRDPREPGALRDEILRAHRGGAVLVVGHSNTVPSLLAALGVEEPPEIGDEQYDDCYVVVISGDPAPRRVAPTLVHLHYGPPAPEKESGATPGNP